jgi:CPA2 family monovalent cation:H+ antiporter-2
VLGTILLVAGIAQRFQVSAAIGAFLVGIAVSGPMARQSHRIFAPLRDLFAATFFFFFGLEIDPASLVPVIPAAVALGLATAFTKWLTGYWGARHAGAREPP